MELKPIESIHFINKDYFATMDGSCYHCYHLVIITFNSLDYIMLNYSHRKYKN